MKETSFALKEKKFGPFSHRFRLLEGERDVLLHDAPGVDGHAGVVRHGLQEGLPHLEY